jgi:hypothetical protein
VEQGVERSSAARETTSSPQTRATAEAPAEPFEEESGEERFKLRIEFFASLLMAFAVVLTAYSAYEATRWSGVQATQFARAGSLRTQANSLTARGVTEVSYDAMVFGQLLIAFKDTNLDDPAVEQQALQVANTLFRDEAKPALQEWIALRENGLSAPPMPLQLPSYSNANLQGADDLTAQADNSFSNAKQANQNGDNYILATILFASVLFFTGLRLHTKRIQIFVVCLAAVALAAGVVRLSTLPFA